MTPAIIIGLAWIIFGGSHLLLSALNLRERWSHRVSPQGFTLLFTVVTCVTMSLLIFAVAMFGDKGIGGPSMGHYGPARIILIILSSLGGFLAIAGLINYPKSPMAVLARRQRGQNKNKPLRPSSSIERVSRHPFFTGIAILMTAHTLLAQTLAGAVYFAGFVVLAIVGIPLQDRKLRKRWQHTYTGFENSTSVVPFTPSKQHKAPDKIEWKPWLFAGVATMFLLGVLHPIWTIANGGLFAVFILMFGLAGVLWAQVVSK